MGDVKYESWTVIRVEELKAYFGFVLLMRYLEIATMATSKSFGSILEKKVLEWLILE